jgi:lysophospholipase L1-like esterase
MRRAVLLAVAALLGAVAVAAAPAGQAAPVGPQLRTPLRIWPLGDSITLGAIGPSTGVAGGYRGFLDLSLQASGVDHQFIGSLHSNSTRVLDARGQSAHDGHPSFYVGELYAGLTGVVDAHGYRGGRWIRGVDPDLVLLHIGTNDVIHRIDPGVRYPTRDGKLDVADPVQRSRFVAHLSARLRAVVDRIHQLRPRAGIVLATVTPVGTQTCDQVTPEYAKAIRALVADERSDGVRIGLADVWASYTQQDANGCEIRPGLLSPDRVHPTSEGYAVMASVFQRALTAITL